MCGTSWRKRPNLAGNRPSVRRRRPNSGRTRPNFPRLKPQLGLLICEMPAAGCGIAPAPSPPGPRRRQFEDEATSAEACGLAPSAGNAPTPAEAMLQHKGNQHMRTPSSPVGSALLQLRHCPRAAHLTPTSRSPAAHVSAVWLREVPRLSRR